MDYRFLEFLGNYFLYAAKYQKQVKRLQSWIDSGGAGFKDIAGIFKTAYGLDGDFSKDEFLTAFQTFQKNFADLFTVTPMVPEKEHLELKKRYENLKKENESQKKTIDSLSSLSKFKDSFQKNMNISMDQALKNQQELFETMMNSFSRSQRDPEPEKNNDSQQKND